MQVRKGVNVNNQVAFYYLFLFYDENMYENEYENK